MLGQARLLAKFKSADLDRTIAFYEGTLGLRVLHRREIMPGDDEVRFEAGGGILCFESGDPQGKTNASSAGTSTTSRRRPRPFARRASSSRSTTIRA